MREPGATSVSLFQALRIGSIQGWAIAWPVLYPAACVIVAVTLACAAMLSVPVLAAWALRRQPPTVFLSYQNARTALALKLRALMQAQGITVRFVPFDPEVGHDQLLQRVVKALDGAQYMVCLPGERNSFVEDEVFAASYACKPIIFVVDHPDGHLPNTGAKKYPVLRTQALQEHEFAPLTELLRYLHGGWQETFKLYFLHNSPVDWVRRLTGIARGIVFACTVLLMLALWFGGLTLYALEFYYSETFKITGMVVLFAGGAVVFGLGLVLSALERLVNGMSGIIRRQRRPRAEGVHEHTARNGFQRRGAHPRPQYPARGEARGMPRADGISVLPPVEDGVAMKQASVSARQSIVSLACEMNAHADAGSQSHLCRQTRQRKYFHVMPKLIWTSNCCERSRSTDTAEPYSPQADFKVAPCGTTRKGYSAPPIAVIDAIGRMPGNRSN